MHEKIVSDPTQDKTPKPTKPVRADKPVTEFKAKLNKVGLYPCAEESVAVFAVRSRGTFDGSH